MKAKKATVTIGHLEVDGYLMDDGRFGMSLSELGFISGISSDKQDSASRLSRKMKSRQALARFPQGFETQTVSVLGLTIKLINIDDVSRVLRIVGTERSEELLDLFVSFSLQQLFCDAFGQKFETQERQAWLQIRTQGIEKRNKWTDAIKAYGESHPVTETWQKWIYCNVSDRLNTALTGHKAKYWCDLLECTPGTLRDNWTPTHLSNVEAIERHATVLCIRGMEPMDALEASIEFFDLAVNPQPQKVQTEEAKYKAERRARGLAN